MIIHNTKNTDALTGKVALVTGGSRGIGRAVSLALAAHGCDVVVNYVSNDDKAHSLVAEIEAVGRRVLAVKADVSYPEEVNKLKAAIEERFVDPVQILVNNAGINKSKPLAELTAEDWFETLNINLTSAFLVTQAFVPAMRVRQWGRIINLSSIAAQNGGVIGPHYAASKAGLLGLTHSYASLLAQEGVTANAIAPAFIATEMLLNNPKIRPDIIPLKRFGDVAEVASVVIELSSNGYLTGQTINVNGGWYMS